MQVVEIVTSQIDPAAACGAIGALTLKAMLAELPEPSLRAMLGAKHANLSATVSHRALGAALAARKG